MFNDSDQFNPIPTSGASVPGFPVGQDQRSQNFVVQETHAFNPALIGVLRFSYLRNKFLYGERTNHTTPASLGFGYTPSLDLAVGPPFIQVNGYTTIGDPITGPRNSYENAFDYSGSLTWVHGRHELKFGGGYQHLQINVLQGIATNGFFVFVPFPVVTNAFASFLFGQPIFFLQGRGDFARGIRGNSLNGYAQDTYRVNNRLTLNLGLRYELPFPYTEVKNRQTLFIPGRQSTVVPDAPTGLLYPGDVGVPAGLIPTFKKGFAPRVGFAWDPTGSAKWLVTSAYGIFYEPYYTGQGGPLQSPISAPPYLQTEQISTPNFADPFNGNPPVSGQFATPLTNLTLDAKLPLPYAQDWDLNVFRRKSAPASRLCRHQGHETSALHRRQSGYLYPRSLYSRQRRPAAPLLRMHARRPAHRLQLFVGGPHRRNRQFQLQRAGSQSEKTLQPWPLLPCLLHLLQGHRRRFFLQHDRLRREARGWRK
jgi:outer membrane receptor protein involved in Fe transport